MSNLYPEKRLNKLGHLVTKHVKATNESVSARMLPAPQASTEPANETQVSRTRWLGAVCSTSRSTKRKLNVAKTKKWLSLNHQWQLDILDDIKSRFEDMPEREQEVIAAAFEPLTLQSMSVETVFEQIRLRDAFCSEWSRDNNARVREFSDYIYCARENPYQPINLDDERSFKEATAVIRFAYELNERIPYGQPTPSFESSFDFSGTTMQEYCSEHTKELVREYADRVDELIEIAAANPEYDAHQLLAALEHEGPKALSSGYL